MECLISSPISNACDTAKPQVFRLKISMLSVSLSMIFLYFIFNDSLSFCDSRDDAGKNVSSLTGRERGSQKLIFLNNCRALKQELQIWHQCDPK